jgi:hypothetical protein
MLIDLTGKPEIDPSRYRTTLAVLIEEGIEREDDLRPKYCTPGIYAGYGYSFTRKREGKKQPSFKRPLGHRLYIIDHAPDLATPRRGTEGMWKYVVVSVRDEIHYKRPMSQVLTLRCHNQDEDPGHNGIFWYASFSEGPVVRLPDYKPGYMARRRAKAEKRG